MNIIQNKKRNRLLVEAVVIVAGILLAFSIDAWWDENKKSHDERILLQSLLEDLHDKKAKVEEGRRYNDAIAQAATRLIQIANGSDSGITEDEIDRLIGDTWWYNAAYGWDSAPMTSLFSGGLASLSDPVLVQKLARLHIQMARIQNFYRLDENFHHDTYTPYLLANAYMPQLTNPVEHQPGVPESPYVFPRFELATRKKHSELIRSEAFQNMMIAKLYRIQDILQGSFDPMDQQLDEAIKLLDTELAN